MREEEGVAVAEIDTGVAELVMEGGRDWVPEGVTPSELDADAVFVAVADGELVAVAVMDGVSGV